MNSPELSDRSAEAPSFPTGETQDVHMPNKEMREARQLQEQQNQEEAMAHIESELENVGDQEQEDVYANYLLTLAQIPQGDFVYGERFKEILFSRGKELKELWNIQKEQGTEETMIKFGKHAQAAATHILNRFMEDNLPMEQFQTFSANQRKSMQRMMDFRTIGLQLKVLQQVAQGNEAGANIAAEDLIKMKIFGDATATVPDTLQSILAAFTKVNVLFTREVLYPFVQKQVEAYAQTGFLRSFKGKAKMTGQLVWDWVRTPFNEGAKKRMTDTLTPAFESGIGNGIEDYLEVIPIIQDLMSTVSHASLSRGQAMSLAKTMAGGLSFDALLLLTPAAVGTAAKVAGSTGKAGTALNTLGSVVRGASQMKKLRLPYVAAISVATIRERARLNEFTK